MSEPVTPRGADRDRLGRRRSPEQGRGLRPLQPPLPEEWTSRVLRVAMPESDWERFEALAAACEPMASTQARAHGMVLSSLLHSVPAPRPEPGPFEWMDWERRKTLRLLLKKSS
jgi:hypothetical protein